MSSVVSSTDFSVQQKFPINPGMASTFPWLSTIARNWEEYQFKSLKACYLTRCSTSTVGSVMLCPDYDAADSQPVSEQVASTYQDATEDAPWKDQCCVIRGNSMKSAISHKYVRTEELDANLDIKTYDSGNLFLITNDGVDSGSKWGKLWLEYDVEFFIPQMQSDGGPLLTTSANLGPGTGSSLANPFGTSGGILSGVGITLDNASNINFINPGSYVFSSQFAGTGLTAGNVTAGAGVTLGEGQFIALSGGTHVSGYFNVQTSGPNQSINVAFSGTTLGGGRASISQMRNADFE